MLAASDEIGQFLGNRGIKRRVVHRMEANSLEFIDILEEPARG